MDKIFMHNISGLHEFVITRDTQIYIFLMRYSGTLDVRILVTQRGVHADVRIIHNQKNQEIFKLTTVQQHLVAHTSSSLLVKGVLYDQAQFNYAGNIYVGPQASQTRAEQKSHTLLLSPTAQAQAIPALEVLTNDVQCKHGSAIASLHTTLIEYLASRGISPADAQDILVQSFFLEILPDESIREYYMQMLDNQ